MPIVQNTIDAQFSEGLKHTSYMQLTIWKGALKSVRPCLLDRTSHACFSTKTLILLGDTLGDWYDIFASLYSCFYLCIVEHMLIRPIGKKVRSVVPALRLSGVSSVAGIQEARVATSTRRWTICGRNLMNFPQILRRSSLRRMTHDKSLEMSSRGTSKNGRISGRS